MRFFGKLAETPEVLVNIAALGVLLSPVDPIPNVLVGPFLAFGTTSVALKATQEWRERNEEIQKNQLYFYYKAGRLLSR